jgi:hypothetical protein
MAEEKSNEKEGPRSFDEIERKLKKALARKKTEMEADREAKKVQEEPAGSSNPVESGERKEALASLEDISNEFKIKIEDLKNKIKEHLDKITQFRKGIESLTGQTIQEFEKMNELSLGLERLGQEVGDKISSAKKEIEEESKVLEKPLKKEEEYEEGVDFGEELARVKKLKEMLRKQEAEEAEEEVEERVEKKMPAPEAAEEEATAKEKEFNFVMEEQPGEMETQDAEMEKTVEAAPPLEKPEEAVFEEKKEAEATTEMEEEKLKEEPSLAKEPEPEFKLDETLETMFSGRWKKHWQEAAQKEEAAQKKEAAVEPEETAEPQKRRASDYAEILKTYRKNEPPEENAEVWYYQKDEKLVLDSECIVLALTKHLAETKKFYTKLSQTASPREQFFIKQEIIRHQESLRDVFLQSVKLIEKSSCLLPKFTEDIVNKEFLKEMVEKLSIENWSNQDDFTFFEENMEKLKSDFNQRITPKVEYLRSIASELGV